VRVRVPVGAPISAVAIPVSGLRRGPEGDHVFTIEADGDGRTRAHLRLVESGALLGDEVLVLHGLTAGETIAASGSFKLREGVLVSVSDEPAPPEPK
jgi:membrane fusion protein (multidrug efflux system)